MDFPLLGSLSDADPRRVLATTAGEMATIDVLGQGDVVGTFSVLGEGRRRAATVLALEAGPLTQCMFSCGAA